MNEREYERLKKLVEDEYRKKLEALEVVWHLAREAQSFAARVARGPSSDSPRHWGEIGSGITTVITAILPRLGPEFTVKDVEPLIRASSSEPIDRSSVSHALKRLAASKLVEVIKIGRGKRPTLYKAAISSRPVASDHEPSLEIATEELAQEIRHLASRLKLDRDDFKAKYMHGHNKIVEMPLVDALSLLDKLKGMADAME